MKPSKDDSKSVELIRDAALKRALNTPHKPHAAAAKNTRLEKQKSKK